jgi:Putative phage tail protein
MATLVLTAVGSAIGGPVGGAIGSIIGQQVDNILFAPKAREGARLKELEVQTSSYGTSVPAVFGAMRVAGTVIWATDLIERRVKNGGGKGRPSTVNYSYSVSMAVALSSRPISRIGRIWADGNLLRGENGDLKVDTQFRFYTGHDDQPVDPLMASAEASGQCSAHRDIAYAVFEDLQLADYGNRIPSMTFEIFERDGAVGINAIFADASGGTINGMSDVTVAGFALSGDDARAGLAPLLAALPVELGVRDGRLVVHDIWTFSGNEQSVKTATSEGSERFAAPRQTVEPVSQFPRSLSLRYYEKARDYQAGVQRSERGNAGRTSWQIEIPAVFDATQAKGFVELRHLQMQYARDAWTGQVAVSEHRFYPGDWLLDLSGAKWRIDEIEHRLGSMTVTAHAAIEMAPAIAGLASPGRNLAPPDLPTGETQLAIVDLPVFDSNDPGKAQIAVFSAGTGVGWRRAALSLHTGTGLLDIGSTALPAIMGRAVTALPPHSPYLLDESASFDIQLLSQGMDIAERAGSPLSSDAPYVWLEGEFIRFGSAEALGGGRYRLSRLQRGCFGSEVAIQAHVAGDRFVLLEADSVKLLTEREFMRGDLVAVEALGLGDALPVSTNSPVIARAITPLSPVHGMAEMRADGSFSVRWARRSRIDLGWRDGVDQVLVEDAEQYLVSLLVEGASVGQWLCDESALSFSAAEYAALAIPPGATPVFAVKQIGRYAQSGQILINIS